MINIAYCELRITVVRGKIKSFLKGLAKRSWDGKKERRKEREIEREHGKF